MEACSELNAPHWRPDPVLMSRDREEAVSDGGMLGILNAPHWRPSRRRIEKSADPALSRGRERFPAGA
jgi:hypothetical protein